MKTLLIIAGIEAFALGAWCGMTVGLADNSDAKTTAGFMFLLGAAAVGALYVIAGIVYLIYRVV